MAKTRMQMGKYELLEELGRGGFATVYKARDIKLDRVVALKVLHPYWREDPGFAARFQREARQAASLRHPGIVVIYEADESNGQLYIAMELLPGRTLHDVLAAEGALPLERAAPILGQVAAALDYAHGQGVIHRDVKPGNIILEEGEHGLRATLVDFGLVKAIETSTALTSHGAMLGSPEYMAPEQADPNRAAEVGPAADRYALGIVAYQMLTGRVPFPGNTPGTLNAHLNLTPPDPHALRAGVSPQVAAALLKMLAKAPSDRFASCREFVSALHATAPAPAPRVARRPIESARPAPTPPAPRAARPSTPRGTWIAAALIGALVLVAVIAALVSSGNQAGRVAQPTARATSTSGAIAQATPTRAPASTVAPAEIRTRLADDMVMVYVPGGTFQMGSNDGNSDEQPVHEVTLDSFWIDRTEVTNAQYALCVKDGKCSAPSESSSYTRGSYYDDSQYADYPVIYVSWDHANDYCAWADAQLPTEAQWEYAARGPQASVYPWGDTFDGTKLNYCDTNCTIDWADETEDDGFADTAPVGSYPEGASWVGALDMAGNVWEWVADWYGTYPSAPQENPTGPNFGDTRVLRGGGWVSPESDVHAAERTIVFAPNLRNVISGFRCVSAAPGE